MDNRLWHSDNGDGTYTNPVIFADFSDPDVIRVKDTYYMTASSFSFTPGLPILVSKDLVNWQLVNYAIKNIDYEQYNYPLNSKGVWAPSIRYHDGSFYIYYGMPDEGIFMVKTTNPLGKWDKPVCVLEGKGLIDPCPYWENDKAYIIHGYAKSRIGFKSILGMFEMSLDGKKAITSDHFIYDGTLTQPTIEGPKVYFKNGYYYIFAPAGGVSRGWQTVLRSKQISGPYEEKIVMMQGDSPVNGPHQGAYIDTVTNESWFIHFQDKGLYGRVVHLQPMHWENDWPIIGVAKGKEYGEPVITYPKPDVGVKNTNIPVTYLDNSDDFVVKLDKVALRKLKGEPPLSNSWQWVGNHREDFYSLQKNKGFLTLKALNPNSETSPTLGRMPNVLTQKIITPYFVSTTRLFFNGLHNNEQTGVCLLGGNYAYLAVRMKDDRRELIYAESDSMESDEEIRKIADIPDNIFSISLSISIENKNKDNLKNPIELTAEDLVFRFSYAFPMGVFHEVVSSFVPKDDTWVGAKTGIFAYSLDCEEHEGEAYFEYVGIDEL